MLVLIRRDWGCVTMSDESLRCRFIVQLLTDYLEDALSSPVHNRVAEHLAECDACSAFLDQMRAIIRAIGTTDVDQLSPDTRQALLSQFRGWYDEQHQAGANPPEAEDEELATGRSTRRTQAYKRTPPSNARGGRCVRRPGRPVRRCPDLARYRMRRAARHAEASRSSRPIR